MSTARFLAVLLCAGACSLAGSFTAAWLGRGLDAAHADSGVLKGSKLIITDDGGKTRAQLDVGSSGATRLSMLDANGKVRVQISAGADRTSISLLDAAGQSRGTLYYDDGQGIGSLTLTDEAKRTRAQLFQKGGASTLALHDSDGDQAAVMGAVPGGRTLLTLAEEGKNRIMARTQGSESAEVMLLNEEGKSTWRAGK